MPGRVFKRGDIYWIAFYSIREGVQNQCQNRVQARSRESPSPLPEPGSA